MKLMHMLGQVAAGALAAALCASVAAAQPGGMSGAVAREAEANARRVQTFLNPSRGLSERLRAGEAAEGVIGVDQATRAIAIFRNPNADPRLRALALDMLSGAVATDANLQRDVAEVLADRTSARVLREQALDIIETLGFSSPASSLAEGTARESLLAMLDDPDAAFRLRAFTLLAQDGDETARSRLVEGLRSPALAAVPPADATRLLGEEPRADELTLLRQVLVSPPEQSTRIEAIRALGRDVESREAITALLRDAQQPQAVRLQALAALNANVAQEEFARYAHSLVGDESAGDSLRVYAIQSLRYRRGSIAETPEDDFDAAVLRAATSASSPVVRQVATEYVRVRGLPQP